MWLPFEWYYHITMMKEPRSNDSLIHSKHVPCQPRQILCSLLRCTKSLLTYLGFIWLPSWPFSQLANKSVSPWLNTPLVSSWASLCVHCATVDHWCRYTLEPSDRVNTLAEHWGVKPALRQIIITQVVNSQDPPCQLDGSLKERA